MAKTRNFVLPIVGAVSTAFLLYGCERDSPRQICIDGASTRVDDRSCLRGGGAYHWYYFPSSGFWGGGGVGGIGSRVSGGTFVRSAGQTYYAAPSEGVTRGGFGGIGGGGGGGE